MGSRFWVSGGRCFCVFQRLSVVRACSGWGFPLVCVLVPCLDRWKGGVTRLDRVVCFPLGLLVPYLDSSKAAPACRSAGVCGRGPVVRGRRHRCRLVVLGCWVLGCLVLGVVWLFVWLAVCVAEGLRGAFPSLLGWRCFALVAGARLQAFLASVVSLAAGVCCLGGAGATSPCLPPPPSLSCL